MPFGDFAGLEPWQPPGRAAEPAVRRRARDRAGSGRDGRAIDALREELRRLIVEELARADQELTVAELRSFIFIDQLQPQTMCYLGTWIRGSLPRAAMAAQIIEVAPGLDIEPLTDVALKHADVQAGILVVERQFGYLEIHGATDAVQAAAAAVLERARRDGADATRPAVLASQIISSSTRSTRS